MHPLGAEAAVGLVLDAGLPHWSFGPEELGGEFMAARTCGNRDLRL